MSTAGGSDLHGTLGVAPTSPVAVVDVDAADEGQSDVDGSEGAESSRARAPVYPEAPLHRRAN